MSLKYLVVQLWSDYVILTRPTLALEFAWAFPRNSYSRLPLDGRCATTRAELSNITHGGTKTQAGSGFVLTTSQGLAQIFHCQYPPKITQVKIELQSPLNNPSLHKHAKSGVTALTIHFTFYNYQFS